MTGRVRQGDPASGRRRRRRRASSGETRFRMEVACRCHTPGPRNDWPSAVGWAVRWPRRHPSRPLPIQSTRRRVAGPPRRWHKSRVPWRSRRAASPIRRAPCWQSPAVGCRPARWQRPGYRGHPGSIGCGTPPCERPRPPFPSWKSLTVRTGRSRSAAIGSRFGSRPVRGPASPCRRFDPARLPSRRFRPGLRAGRRRQM